MKLLASIAMALVFVGCGEEEAHVDIAPARPSVRAPLVAGRPVADLAAFAIVPTGEGALLVWGAPTPSGGGVRAIALGPLGEAAGREALIAPSQAVEVEAAAAGRRVGVAWVLDDADRIETLSAFSLDAGHSFARPEELGPTVRIERGERGRLSMGTSGDAIMLYHRLPDGPCVASRGTCALFSRRGVGSGASQALRDRSPDEVREPCEPLVSGAIHRQGTWYHTVCDRLGGQKTTLFAFRAEVSYAAAIPIVGCRPMGIAPLDEGIAVLASCPNGIAAWQFDEMARERAHFAPVERSVSCTDARPIVRIARGARERTLRLGEATDHVEPLLPEHIAPPGTRAVWTGEALLVAGVVGREVVVHRYQCVHGRFDRTD